MAAHASWPGAGAHRRRVRRRAREEFWLRVFAPVYAVLPWSVRSRILRAMPGSHRRRAWNRRRPGPGGLTVPDCPLQGTTIIKESAVAQIVGERANTGDAIVDYEDKVFEDIQAEPGEQACILMHTVPYEGSVGLVNMLTVTRINRKGFDTHLVPVRARLVDGVGHPRVPDGG